MHNIIIIIIGINWLPIVCLHKMGYYGTWLRATCYIKLAAVYIKWLPGYPLKSSIINYTDALN